MARVSADVGGRLRTPDSALRLCATCLKAPHSATAKPATRQKTTTVRGVLDGVVARKLRGRRWCL